MVFSLWSLVFGLWSLQAASFDAAPFSRPLSEGAGIYWDDPREIHRVVIHFSGSVPPADAVQLEYWGSRWPEQHLPKDKPTGAGGSGWMELGNWYRGGWRVADTVAQPDGNAIVFTFRPVNAKEFPKVKEYPAEFRYTLKIRVTSRGTLPEIKSFEAFTDSTMAEREVRILSDEPLSDATLTAFNGAVQRIDQRANEITASLRVCVNPDPNTFDRTMVTVRNGDQRRTFAVDDLKQGPLLIREAHLAIFPGQDKRTYPEALRAQEASGAKTLYQRVAEHREQSWTSAWEGMPPKKNPIYVPLGLDGGRQRFRLNPDGSIQFRSNDHYLQARPGKDTAPLALEKPNRHLRFNLPGRPMDRSLDEDSLPICKQSWQENGIRIEQFAFVTELDGADANGPVPPGDATAVFLSRFTLRNPSAETKQAHLAMKYDDSPAPLRCDTNGVLWVNNQFRGQVLASVSPAQQDETLRWDWTIAPGQSKVLILKFPYLVLTDPKEQAQLTALDFDSEYAAIAGFWRRRADESARLITPEPVLNEMYRAFATHLLINCEHEPGAARRFARVGSFGYGAYGNESCMMVVDLDRRGYPHEAEECLNGWLQYQSTVGLPGDFSTSKGVLYGDGGYEAGGYNQHHGWILWCMAEHYRFTRDRAWLAQAAPGMVLAGDWIIGQCRRTQSRDDLSRGLLPAGTLEDIGDWWTWLSTSCYTWRGLDAAAWALTELNHPEAPRLRQEADAYRQRMLAAFRTGAERSPVVRLRNGVAVPHFPSYVERRGRSFGWIEETLEGALHLLITGALPAKAPEASWILNDYEDNLFLSQQYGYTLENFDRDWFRRGGMSMQACLLLDVEPYLDRDDIPNALRAMFNAIAVSHFPDVHMNTEHALPNMGDWAGDHYKSSDEANAAGWLRKIFVREDGNELLLGQAIPRDWLTPGRQCGIERAATYFGEASVLYAAAENEITATVDGPRRNPPAHCRVRFREPQQRAISSAEVNGRPWKEFGGEWVRLPGDLAKAVITVRYR